MLTAVPSPRNLFFLKKAFQKVCSLHNHSCFCRALHLPHHPVPIPPPSPYIGTEDTSPSQAFLLSPSPSLFLWTLCSRELPQVPHSTLQPPPCPCPAPAHWHPLSSPLLGPAGTTADGECPAAPVKGTSYMVKWFLSRSFLQKGNLSYSPLRMYESEQIVPNTHMLVCKLISEEGWRFKVSLKQHTAKAIIPWRFPVPNPATVSNHWSVKY